MRNERRLARRASRGDREAFAAIFRLHQQNLYRYCAAILGDAEDAQDALQNTMVKALAALPGEEREIELKPWLYRIAHNESIELRRRARVADPLEDDAPSPRPSVDQSAADRQRLRDLLADLDELPERQRGALVMRELAGLDFEQIGAALETSAAAARQVLYEARLGLVQMNEGREMRCDAVTAVLSDEDGRVMRRRDVRAHLRRCNECRAFAAAISSRSETLAGISPLPAAVAAGLLKSTLSGASGASTAGLPAAGGAATAGGATAKAVSTAALLKSAAGVLAVVTVGTVAVDHGHLLHANGAGGAAAAPVSRSPAVSTSSSSEAKVPLDRPTGRRSSSGSPSRVADLGASAPAHADKVPSPKIKTVEVAGGDTPSATPVGGSASSPGPAPAAEGAGGKSSSPVHPEHPPHPPHPEHPTRVTVGEHPAHPVHAAANPVEGAASTPPKKPHPEPPSRSETEKPAAPDGEGEPETNAASDAAQSEAAHEADEEASSEPNRGQARKEAAEAG